MSDAVFLGADVPTSSKWAHRSEGEKRFSNRGAGGL